MVLDFKRELKRLAKEHRGMFGLLMYACHKPSYESISGKRISFVLPRAYILYWGLMDAFYNIANDKISKEPDDAEKH